MKRLLDELGAGPRRDVLASAEDDAHRPEGRERALAAALAALGAPSATATVKESPTTTSAGSSATLGKVLALAAVTVGIGAVVVAIVAGGRATSTDAPVPSSSSSPEPSTTIPSADPMMDPAAYPVAPTASSGFFEPSPPITMNPRGALRPTPSGTPRAEDILALEVRAIEAARGALNAGDPARALRELDGYDRIGGAETLRPESRVLRLEALAKVGRNAEARTLGVALRSDPTLVSYARRIDLVLDRVSSKDGGV